MFEYLKQLDQGQALLEKIKCTKQKSETCQQTSDVLFTTEDDYKIISSFTDKLKDDNIFQNIPVSDNMKTFSAQEPNMNCLKLEDLVLLNNELQKQRTSNHNLYLHEILSKCTILVPENETVNRSPELEKRCNYLKTKQDNLRYRSMTKNVDNVRTHEPEETIAYQMKQLNKQLIAVFQFIVSVLTGFAFGFIGIELIVGNLDFGFRLLLGIMSALTVALAELYFLAKQLNE
ncbi:uncharacterized protein CBL_13866 [Carabus blaptoides fortunei]